MKLRIVLTSAAIVAVTLLWVSQLSAQTSYVWHDGELTYKVYLQDAMVAEFGDGETEAGSSVVRSGDPGASVHQSAGAVRIWKTTGNAQARFGRGAKHGKTRISPVFSADPKGG